MVQPSTCNEKKRLDKVVTVRIRQNAPANHDVRTRTKLVSENHRERIFCSTHNSHEPHGEHPSSEPNCDVRPTTRPGSSVLLLWHHGSAQGRHAHSQEPGHKFRAANRVCACSPPLAIACHQDQLFCLCTDSKFEMKVKIQAH